MKIVLASSVLIVALGGTAVAGKYNCEFQKDGTAAHSCPIDSSGTAVCEYKFSTNLNGMCGVQALDNTADMLLCALFTPTAAAANFLQGLPRDAAGAARALAQKPGFVAGGLTIAPTGKGLIAGLYKEQQNAPTLAGVCGP